MRASTFKPYHVNATHAHHIHAAILRPHHACIQAKLSRAYLICTTCAHPNMPFKTQQGCLRQCPPRTALCAPGDHQEYGYFSLCSMAIPMLLVTFQVQICAVPPQQTTARQRTISQVLIADAAASGQLFAPFRERKLVEPTEPLHPLILIVILCGSTR